MEDIEQKGVYIASLIKSKEKLESEMVAHGIFNHIAVTLNKIQGVLKKDTRDFVRHK